MESITLHDDSAGTSALILPGRGFNCCSFQARVGDEAHEVLWSAPGFAEGAARPSSSGIPLLFPFAGRIRGTSFRFAGSEYTLEANDRHGNAIHGFVMLRPWRVVEQSARRATGMFEAAIDGRECLPNWPADFRISVTYELTGNLLASEVLIENPDDRPLPFAFGAHGYFRVPLGSKGSAADCRVTVPVSRSWELVNLLPTGREFPSETAAQLAAGMSIGESKLDDVLSGIQFTDGRCTSSIHDPHSGRTLSLTFDDQFAACVVFTPPHREAICIEPYTAAPDPYFLREQGLDAGLRILAPGEKFQTRIDLALY